MGRPKALLAWGGTTLISHLCHCYIQAGCAAVYVVVGGEHGAALTAEVSSIDTALVITNPDPSRGMLSSLQVGLKAALASGCQRIAFSPVDVPLAGPGAVRTVLAQAGDYVVAAFDGRPGHPALVGPTCVRALLSAAPTAAARDVLARFDRTTVDTRDPGVCGNINTPADAESWRRSGPEKDVL